MKLFLSILFMLASCSVYSQRIHRGYQYLLNTRTGQQYYGIRDGQIKLPKESLYDTLLLCYDLPYKFSVVSMNRSFLRKGMTEVSATDSIAGALLYPCQQVPHFFLSENDMLNRRLVHAELPWMFFEGDRIFLDDIKAVFDQRVRPLGSIQILITN